MRTTDIQDLAAREKRGGAVQKDQHIQGRKYNGRPYLRLKAVKETPRLKIRTLLRSFEPLK